MQDNPATCAAFSTPARQAPRGAGQAAKPPL